MTTIPLFEPDFGSRERKAVLGVLERGWIAMGAECEALERSFADILGMRHALAVTSCTAALHLAYHLVGIRPGDEVIVPSLTFAATANAVVYCGGTPVFADINSDTDWTISPDDVARRITKKTRAIVVMHYGGAPCDMGRIMTLAQDARLPVVEDACHGLGGTADGRPMGAFGAASCFSFYSNKIITTGEGGMLVTDDDDMAARGRRLRSHGQSAVAYDRIRGALGYEIEEIGFNYRLDDLRAALGRAQLARLSESVERRRALHARYKARLATIPAVTLPDHGGRGAPAHYVLPVLLAPGIDRDRVRAEMHEHGVQTSWHYPPVHNFTPYRNGRDVLPITDDVAARTLTLPMYPRLRDDQVDRVGDALEAAIVRVRGG